MKDDLIPRRTSSRESPPSREEPRGSRLQVHFQRSRNRAETNSSGRLRERLTIAKTASSSMWLNPRQSPPNESAERFVFDLDPGLTQSGFLRIYLGFPNVAHTFSQGGLFLSCWFYEILLRRSCGGWICTDDPWTTNFRILEGVPRLRVDARCANSWRHELKTPFHPLVQGNPPRIFLKLLRK